MKKKIIAFVIAAAVAAGVAFYALSGSETPEAEPIKTAKVTKGSLRLEAMANGIVTPDVEVIVKGKAGGEIIDFPYNEGDVVRKGEVIVRLDPETEQARAKQAEATLLMTEARLEKARIARKDAQVKLGRQKKLFEDGIISRQELEDAEIGYEKAGTDVKLSQAELMQSREALNEANKRLADTRITAPFTGTILKKFVDRGQVISSTLSSASEGTQIFSMANLDNIFVTAHVDEVDISRIAPGQAAIVKADSLPGREFSAQVERVAPKGRIDMTVTIFDVVVRVTDGEKALLKPGMSADVSITTSV
ncbi:MAG TPA: efflux RND transporter periplasmic adaptor subunit, partial [Thermodesulfobacteriota bacterium]